MVNVHRHLLLGLAQANSDRRPVADSVIVPSVESPKQIGVHSIDAAVSNDRALRETMAQLDVATAVHEAMKRAPIES